MATITVKLGLNEWRLVKVFAFLFVFVNPQVREHLSNFVGHQTREDGITGILCSSRKNATV